MQAPGGVAKRRADLPLAHPLRDDEEEVREPGQLLLLRPPCREPEVALELARECAERLGTPVVLQVELAGSARMQVAPKPVRFHLGGPRADPVLGPPGGQTVVLVGSGGLGERAEEGVDPKAVGEQLVRPVAVVGTHGRSETRMPFASAISARPGFVRYQHAGGLPSPKPLPTESDETRPRSFRSFIRC